jgi:hypothetical protein
MDQQEPLQQVLEANDKRRAERREFFRYAGGFGIAAAGAAVLSACGSDGDDDSGTVTTAATPSPTPTASATATPTPTPTPATEADILNFALNLEYLEAQFYSFAATGTGLAASLLSGTGTAGDATGGRQVKFTDPLVARYAREIAADEQAHVAFLRRTIGNTAVIAQPAIDLGTAATSAFATAAVAAGLIQNGQTFDPYASDENFLLAAFLFEDVGVTAYRGLIGALKTTSYIDATAGLQASEAYHAGLVRTVLYRKGVNTSSLIEATEKISGARDALDGAGDFDQGVKLANNASNIVPSDATGIAFGRNAPQVLNIAYLTNKAATSGGFFPKGVNGFMKSSAAT